MRKSTRFSVIQMENEVRDKRDRKGGWGGWGTGERGEGKGDRKGGWGGGRRGGGLIGRSRSSAWWIMTEMVYTVVIRNTVPW